MQWAIVLEELTVPKGYFWLKYLKSIFQATTENLLISKIPLLLDDFADSTSIAGVELISLFLDDKVHIV